MSGTSSVGGDEQTVVDQNSFPADWSLLHTDPAPSHRRSYERLFRTVHTLATRDPVSTDVVFRRGAAGLPCWVADSNGGRQQLPVGRWLGGSAASSDDLRADRAILASCLGPTLDLGCGPGRLTSALAGRGQAALGVDVSATAVAMTLRRGGSAVRRSLFDSLPGTGHWSRILLVDGNIGIGGDPVRILRRASELLDQHGVIIAEVSPPNPSGVLRQHLRWETDTHAGHWFEWARVSVVAAPSLATAAGLRVLETTRTSSRHFVRMGLA